jgi:hypothetical protein
VAVVVFFMPAAQTVLVMLPTPAAKEVLTMLRAETVTPAARLNQIARKFERRRRPVGPWAALWKETC